MSFAVARGPNRMRINGVELCVETFGTPGDPPILLIMGSGASMDFWEDRFCTRLRDGGRFVIRYDHRDTGQSVAYEPGKPGYTGDDLVADAAGVIEAVGLRSAHVVGLSMGGALAQHVALDHRERTDTLTLIATSAGPGDDDLPGIDDRLRDAFAVPQPDVDDRPALLEYLTDLSAAHAAASRPFDRIGTRALWERSLQRARDVASMLGNHQVLEGGGAWRHRLTEIDVPTLVIHGTEDPLFPLAHGAALAREIPNADLLELHGSGHELPRRTWDVVVPAILRHTA